MLKLKTVTFFVAHVFLKRLCLPMPSLSIDRFHLIQLLPMISPCVPITFIDNFMKLLYVTFFLKIYLLFKPRCALFGCSTGTSFEALAGQEKIYSGKVNTDML